ncbi:MAG: PQQ-binding-like beta-propeller repeat protein [Acidobacteriota bacterium]|nr:PQQ-binding-like beta-propeller repeat protein [Acidobacteriota bacterium]
MLAQRLCTLFLCISLPVWAASTVTLTKSWTATVSSLQITAAPVVGDGLVFVGTASGEFKAIDKDSGKVVWSQPVKVSPLDQPDPPKCVDPLGVSSRAVLWRGNVYVAGADASLYAFNQSTGEKLWSRDLSQSMAGAYIWANLLLVGDALYAGIGSAPGREAVAGTLVRIDLNDPSNVQTVSFMQGGEGAGVRLDPLYDASSQSIFVATGPGMQDPDNSLWGNALLALDPLTLAIKASYLLPALRPDAVWSGAPMLFSDSSGNTFVTASTKSGDLHVLATADLSEAWTLPIAIGCICAHCGCGSISTPAFDSGILYIGSGTVNVDFDDKGTVFAWDTNAGSLLWAVTLPGVVFGPVSVYKDAVVVSTTQGMVLLDRDAGTVLRSLKDSGLGEVTLGGGSLYSTDPYGALISWRLTP